MNVGMLLFGRRCDLELESLGNEVGAVAREHLDDDLPMQGEFGSEENATLRRRQSRVQHGAVGRQLRAAYAVVC